MSNLLRRLFLGFVISLIAASPAFAATLVGYWPFDDGAGAQVADQSGNANHGGLTGAVRSTGKVGQGVLCNSNASGCVTVPPSATLNALPGGFTFSAWVHPSSATVGYMTLFSKSPDPFNPDPLQVTHQLHLRLHDDGHLQCVMNNHVDYGGFQGVTAAGVVPPEAWSHVAWTYDESMHRLYVNGIEVFAAPFNQAWAGSAEPLTLGHGLEPFVGKLDEVRLYHAAQSAAQVLADMEVGSTPALLEDLLRGNGLGYTVELVSGPLDLSGVGCGTTFAPDDTGVIYAYEEAGLIDQVVRIPVDGEDEVIAESGNIGVPTSACSLAYHFDGSLRMLVQHPLAEGVLESYLLKLLPPEPVVVEPVATPAISPNGGTFTGSVVVMLTTATAGAEIRYTTDGSAPTAASTLYAGPVSLTNSATLSAKAFHAGQPESAVASAAFTINPPPAEPTVMPGPSTSNRSSGWVVLPNNEIYYWNANEWLEYQVDFGAGGQWTITVEATNRNSASSPGLPSGYQFNLDVRLDGALKGSLKVPGSATGYRIGSFALTAPAGVHTVRLTWTNNVFSSGQYDSNIQIRDVTFAPAAFVGSPPPRLMAAGASITAGSGDDDPYGYRNHLQGRVGLGVFDFVGSFKAPSSDPVYDVDHQGAPGDRTDQLNARLTTALPAKMPAPNPAGSAILVHIGTNDILQGVAEATAVANIANMVDIITAHDPGITVYVGLLIPSTHAATDEAITSFNTALSAQLTGMQASHPRLRIVDLNAVFKQQADWAGYFVDSIHPNDAGYALMAAEWDKRLRGL